MIPALITPGMVCRVAETRVCPIFADEALTTPLDPIVHHRGTVKMHADDVLTVLAVVESTALARVSGSLIGIWTQRLEPSEVTKL